MNKKDASVSTAGLRRGLERWCLRCGLVAATAAVLELTLVLWVFPTAASHEPGLVASWLGVFWIFGLVTAVLGVGCSLLQRWGWLGKLLAARGVLFHVSTPIVLGLVALSVAQSGAYDRLQVHVPELRALGFTLALGGAWLAAFGLRAALLRWAPGAARLGAEHGLRLALAAGALGCALVIHFTLGPANADEAVRAFGVLELSALLLSSWWLIPDARALPPWLAPGLAVIWVAAPVFWSMSPHARFVVRAHCPTATSLWATLDGLTDFDGDGASPSWLAGTDCAAFDENRGPLVREIVADGVDQDCWGGDATPVSAPPPAPLWADCRAPADASVLLLSIDAWRADALSAEITPEIARFSAFAASFEQAYPPASMTGGTTLSMMMGRALIDLNAKNVYTDSEIVVSETLAERLAARDYRTFAFLPFDLHPAIRHGFAESRYARPRDRVLETNKRLMSAELSNQALEEIAGSPQKFFGWVHYPDLHAPYIFEQSGDSGATAPAYLRAARYVDGHVGRVLRWLHASGWLDRTVVVITADHGEQLGQRGREGHGASLFDEGIRVPLVLWVPGCSPRRLPYAVSLRHLPDTLHALIGGGASQSTWFAPASLPIVVEEANSDWNGVKRAVLWGRHKLIVDMRLGGKMLFDLGADPGEIENLYPVRPDIVTPITQAYQRWLDAPLER